MALYLRSFASRLPTCTTCISNVILTKPHVELTSIQQNTPIVAGSPPFPPLFYKSYVSQQKADCEDLSSHIAKLAAETKSLDVAYFSKCMPFVSAPSVINFQELSRLNAVPQPKAKATGSNETPTQPQKSPESDGKPSAEQLDKVASSLETSPINYRILSPNIVLEDNIRGKVYKGLSQYVQQMFVVRFMGHLKFAFVEVELLSLTKLPQEGRVTIRWRIKGISGLRVFLKFWKYKLWNYKRIMDQAATWYDGISHYDVGADGLVFRHIVDKLEHDKEQSVDSQKDKKLRLAAKLAGASSA